MEEATAPELAIGQKAVRGAFSLTIATYVSVVLGVVARKWLAVLLLPAVFGVIQAALSFVDLVFSFSAFSFSSAIINVRKNLVSEPLEYLNENIFLLTVGLNGLLGMVALLLGVLFAHELGGYVVLALIGVYVAQRFVSALDTLYTQMLERELDYKRVSRVSLAANILLHSASVAIALIGFGPWSIPVATLLSALLSFYFDRHYAELAGVHIIRTTPWRHYNRATSRWLWKFGTNVFFNRLFESWLFRVDNMLVLAFLGTSLLGIYSQAFAIAQMPAIALAPVVARVSIATYASVQHDRAKLQEAFTLTNYFLIRLLVPATIVMVLTSADVVRLFLSSAWSAGAAPLAALAGFVLTIPLFENGKMLLGARLRLKEISIVRGSQLGVLVIAILLVGRAAITNVAFVVSGVSVAGYLLLIYFVRSEVSIELRRVFLVPITIGVAVSLSFVFAVAPQIAHLFPPAYDLQTAIARIVIYGLSVPVITLGLEWLIAPADMRIMISSVRRRMKH